MEGDILGDYSGLLKIHGEYCLSWEKGKDCYGKPCACNVCGHEEYFYVNYDTGPCLDCNGKDEDRTTEFCIPDEDD